MTTYNTGNPVPSTAVKDLSDNAENFDKALNDRTADTWTDRLGAERKTWHAFEQALASMQVPAYSTRAQMLASSPSTNPAFAQVLNDPTAENNGIYVSTDGGVTWAKTEFQPASDAELSQGLAQEQQARQNADQEEATLRAQADTALGQRIDDEVLARQQGDAAEAQARATAIQNEATARQQADGVETQARQQADAALGGRIDDEATARQQADQQIQQTAGAAAQDAATALQTANTANQTATGAAQAVDSERTRAQRTEALIGAHKRPGDFAAAYSTAISGTIDATTPLPDSMVVTDAALGFAVQVEDERYTAPRSPMALELGRVYELRYVVKRQTNPNDPLNDAVRLGVRFMGADQAGISGAAGNVTLETLPLVVADGEVAYTFTLSREAGEGVDVVAPAAARYVRPWVQTFGVTHQTRIGRVSIHDATLGAAAQGEIGEIGEELAQLQADLVSEGQIRAAEDAALWAGIDQSVADRKSVIDQSDGDELDVVYDETGAVYAARTSDGEAYIPGLGAASVQGSLAEIKQRIDSAPARHDFDESQFRVIDPQGNVIVAGDAPGRAYIPGLGAASVSDAVHEVSDKAGRNPAQYDYAPEVLRLTDAERHVLASFDAQGGLRIPGLSGHGIHERLASFSQRIESLVERDKVYDLTRDLGVPNDGKNYVGDLIQRAVDWVSAQGGGVIYARGVFKIDREIEWRSRVSLVGAGWGVTRFLMCGAPSSFRCSNSRQEYIEDAFFTHLEIDGSEQSYPSTFNKGFYFERFRRCLFFYNWIHDTGATGMGCDLADGSAILYGRYENCGRYGEPGEHGRSGIGVGTGLTVDEPLVIHGNVCVGNKNYGIFNEWQSNRVNMARQVIVSHNVCTANYHGIGDCGLSGAIHIGNQMNDNTACGFIADTGTLNPANGRPRAGVLGIAHGNQALRNGVAGLCYDATKVATTGGYAFSDNRVAENGVGVLLLSGEDMTIPDIRVGDNDIVGNLGAGVEARTGAWSDLDIMNNRMLRNVGPAVVLTASVVSGSLFGNRVRDTQVTPTQTSFLAGDGVISNFDISENHYVGPNPGSSAINLPNADASVTYGRNPGAQ